MESCSIKSYEIKVTKFFVVSQSVPRLPFELEDAQRADLENEDSLTVNEKGETVDASGVIRVNLDTRLDNRIIDLRVWLFFLFVCF